MPRGIYTQSIAILFSKRPTPAKARKAFADLNLSENHSKSDTKGHAWALSPGFNIYPSSLPGATVVLDIVPHPWPDHMGHPMDDPDTYASWGLGHFGPATHPNAFDQALLRCHAPESYLPPIKDHTAFIRLRITYALGSSPHLKPHNYAPLTACAELDCLDDLSLRLFALPGALAYFNPAGQILHIPENFTHFLKQARSLKLHNLFTWTNRRLFSISESWSLIDTIGNQQLGLPDMEMAIPSDAQAMFRPCKIFLTNTTLLLINDPHAIAPGSSFLGPDDRDVEPHFFKHTLAAPNRPAILWLPVGTKDLPPEFPTRLSNNA